MNFQNKNPFEFLNDEINTDRHNLINTNEINNEDKERIKKLSVELAKELVDNKSVLHNSSINQGFPNDYVKNLEDKYYILKREFNTIDNNADHKLGFDEIENFFINKTINNKVIDKNYIERLFKLLDKDKDSEISIEEFIFSYIKLEEKLKLKKKKLQYLLDDLKENLKQYLERLNKSKNEILNRDGICENASLSITLFEAKDIIPKKNLSSPNTFVVFTVEGKKQKSNIVENSLNPQFFEDFAFPISKRGETLRVELYENTDFENELIGYVDIDLVLLEHQQKTEIWYALKLNSDIQDEEFGSIHLRLRYIYNWNKYYNDLIAKTQLQIKRLNEDIVELNKCNQLFNQPFGIILAGEINSIIEKRVFEKSEDILEYITSERKSIYVLENSVILKKPSITLNPSETNYVNFNNQSVFLIYICLILSSLEFLNRCDYLSLLLMIGLYIVLKRNNKNDTDTYCEYLVRGILFSIFFDLFYLFLIGGEFRLSRVQNKVSSFLSFIFSILNLVGKVILGYLLWVRNTKMKMMRESETDKILKNDVRA